MKKITILFSGIIAFTMLSFKSLAPGAFIVDVNKSNIEWTGKKVLGQHNGTIKLSAGQIQTNGKIPTSGSFVINMNSIDNTDLSDADSKGKLLGHLKSDDFFGVEKFPTASFQATKIAATGAGAVQVTGKLTIKGKSDMISFPATYNIAGNVLKVTAKDVKVNRTKFDVKYGSKSFFESIGDKAIDDEFLLNIYLVATR